MERVWGGRRLESLFGKQLPPGKSIGESWEITDREEAQSVVRQGPWRGRTLHELWLEHRLEIFGDGLPDAPRYPILAKLLDARETLSIQVHPPASVAASLGGQSKSEVWYFADAAEGGEIFAGLRRGVTPDQFQQALDHDRVADLVARFPVRTGDSFFVPSGRLHAIGGGNVIVEIQENSDTTYRVYDWARTDDGGEPRQLHREQAMQAIDFSDFDPALVRQTGEVIVRCPQFTVEKWELSEPRRAHDLPLFALFFCLSGAVEMGETRFKPGEFFLVPAAANETPLQPGAKNTSLLRITQVPA
ncbi:MAG: mannose-6-phosphate isomerase [Chthoniobacterales bacterium]|nr:mannose-6-phosphate isomerase [Chthoniobacterales bacterium]